MKRRVESDAEEDRQESELIASDQEATGEEEAMDYEEEDGERIDYSDEDEDEVDDDDKDAVDTTKVYD